MSAKPSSLPPLPSQAAFRATLVARGVDAPSADAIAGRTTARGRIDELIKYCKALPKAK